MDLGSAKQLFIDAALMESSRGITLTMNPPRKTGERCVVAERAWEGHRPAPSPGEGRTTSARWRASRCGCASPCATRSCMRFGSPAPQEAASSK